MKVVVTAVIGDRLL